MMQVRCSESSSCRSCCPARRTPAASSTDPRCARASRGPRCVSAGVCPCLSLGVCQCLSVCVSVSRCLSVSLGVCQCLSVSLGVCQCLSVSVSVSRCVSVCVSVSRCVSVSLGVSRCLSLTLRCVPGCEGRSLSSASAAAGPALGKRLECMASRFNIQRVRFIFTRY